MKTPSSPSPVTVEKEPAVHRVILSLCELCLEGKGEECHTPECALCFHNSPGHPIQRGLYEIPPPVLGEKDAASATTVQEKESLEKPGAAIEPRTVQGPMERSVSEDYNTLRRVGNKLAEAAIRVCREYDGTHRLLLAVAEWTTAVAGEGGRAPSSPKATESADVGKALRLLNRTVQWLKESKQVLVAVQHFECAAEFGDMVKELEIAVSDLDKTQPPFAPSSASVASVEQAANVGGGVAGSPLLEAPTPSAPSVEHTKEADSGLKEAASDNVTATGQNTLRCFLDTEFIEAGRHSPVQLISIGIVTKDGEFYAESQEFDPKTVSPWLKENVLPHLGPVESRKPVALIAREVREFIGDAKPEFWGYYADYDWVVFCQMFGGMIDLPEGWPMYCRDIKQLCDSLGNPKLPPNDGAEHNALSDAKWNEKALRFLLSEHGGQPESASGVSSPSPSAPASVEHVEQEKWEVAQICESWSGPGAIYELRCGDRIIARSKDDKALILSADAHNASIERAVKQQREQ